MENKDRSEYYRKHVFICINQRPEGDPKGCCWDKRSVRRRLFMKNRAKELGLDDVRINASGCLDRCELGPTMVIYPEGVWYTFENDEDIEEILQRHVIDDARVDRLRLPPPAPDDA
jgi:(2Fe-2S) ferredoxin